MTTAELAAMVKTATHCPLCEQAMAAKHVDHIIPINIGGTHTRGNVRVICAKCNLSRPHDGSDLNGHQPTLWSVDLRAAQAAAALRAARPPRAKREPQRTVKRSQVWQQRARAAAAARRMGMQWQQIADALGYASPGAVHNSIRLRLGLNPCIL